MHFLESYWDPVNNIPDPARKGPDPQPLGKLHSNLCYSQDLEKAVRAGSSKVSDRETARPEQSVQDSSHQLSASRQSALEKKAISRLDEQAVNQRPALGHRLDIQVEILFFIWFS